MQAPTPLQAQRSPASERNRQPILDVLQRVVPDSGAALEIASGTGQHVAFFAAAMPQWTWQPSDMTPSAFGSIAAWCAQEGVANVRAPVLLDVLAADWPVDDASMDLVYCANMLHIAPWPTCAALMRGAARCLVPQGQMVTYGPYLEQGVATSQGNLDFDVDLRQRNPAWGIRALEDVSREAEAAGLRLAQRFQMPANNLLLVWARASRDSSGGRQPPSGNAGQVRR